MTPHLRMPLPSLSVDNFLARGAAGHVFQISPNIVFKCPTKFDDLLPQQLEGMKESAKKMEAEKAVYQIVMNRPHPNTLQCILCVPEGIFLRRMECTLQERLSQSSAAAIPSHVQERWVRQLTSAIAWLESLNLVHGDLRPANILRDADENIRLGDFDAAVRPGAELVVASEPFCRLNEDFEPPLAGPVSEQFALASCIYTIRFRKWPWHDLEPRGRVRKMARGEFPSVDADCLFGEVMRRCWRGEYASITAVEQDVLCRLGRAVADQGGGLMRQKACTEDDGVAYSALRSECEEFLATQAPRAIC